MAVEIEAQPQGATETKAATTEENGSGKEARQQQAELPLKKETVKADSSKTETSPSANGATKTHETEPSITAYEKQLRRDIDTERQKRQDAERRADESEKQRKELEKFKEDQENAELAAQKKHQDIAEKERKAREKAEKELESERQANKRERLLDRAEAIAAKNGIRDEAIEDLRVALERRANKEDVNLEGLAEIIDGYKTSKPHWFAVAETKAEVTTTTTTADTKKAEEEKNKKNTSSATPLRKESGTEAKTDWGKSTQGDWRAHMASMGVKV